MKEPNAQNLEEEFLHYTGATGVGISKGVESAHRSASPLAARQYLNIALPEYKHFSATCLAASLPLSLASLSPDEETLRAGGKLHQQKFYTVERSGVNIQRLGTAVIGET